jgi:hypothetical protein
MNICPANNLERKLVEMQLLNYFPTIHLFAPPVVLEDF